MKLSNWKFVSILTYPMMTRSIWDWWTGLPEDSKKVENINWVKIKISNFGAFETEKELKRSYEKAKDPHFNQGSFTKTYEEFKKEVLNKEKINKHVEVDINNFDFAIIDFISESEYSELIKILNTLKIFPLKKSIDWNNIKSSVLWDNQMKSLVFTDNDWVNKTIYVKWWDMKFWKDVLIIPEIWTYKKEENTIWITPVIWEHFNDSYTLNLNTGVLRNNTTK